MGVRQPVMQRHQTHFGAIADQQKYKSQTQDGRIKRPGVSIQFCPQQGVTAYAKLLFGGEIQ